MEKDTDEISPAKPFLRKNWERVSWLKNKYLLAGVFFLAWIFFFDPKDLISTIKRQAKLKELQKSDEHLNKKINESEQELSQLKTDAQTIEKYARENYLMKKDNEDLYIFMPKDANK